MDTTESKNNEVEQEKITPQDSTSVENTEKETNNTKEVEETSESEKEVETPTEIVLEVAEEAPKTVNEVTEIVAEVTETVAEVAEVVVDITEEVTENEAVSEELVTDSAEIALESEVENVKEVKETEVASEEIIADVAEETTNTVSEDTSETPEVKIEKIVTEVSDEDAIVNYDEHSMEELAAALTELVTTDNIESIKSSVGNIKSNFIKKIKQIKLEHFEKHIASGGTEDDYKTIRFDYEDIYKAAFDTYKEKRRIYIEQLEKTKIENLKKKEDLLENLRNMIHSEENLNTVYKSFQKLQEDWREIGLIPQGEVKNLWNNYHFLVEKFFDKVKINRELMMIGLNKNLEEKILLCEKTEELLLDKSINKSFLKLQEYHTKWKEIGPVPNEKNDEIWERFSNVSNMINERRRKHYDEMHEEQKQNLLLKTALCDKIEAITEHNPDSIDAWAKLTDEVNAIFLEWKTVGPTPKTQNEEIWIRFKTSMNNFFNEKKNYFSKIKDEQMNNYQLKLNLVAQAESIKDSQEWKNTTQTLIDLQKKWKTIGPVPRKYSNIVWKKFRSACDYFFNSKDEFFKNINVAEKENKGLCIELIEKFEKQEFTDDNKASLDLIKQYQREWIAIGRVPLRDKSNLHAKFHKVVEKHLDSLNIDSFEFENAALQTRIEGAENPRDAERMIQKEVNFIKGKIETIVKDVTLWENNISFFGNSKNADLLKADFEKKIAKAKNDIKVFKTKLRQFDKLKRGLNE